MKFSDIKPEALAELRAAGYKPTSYAEAMEAAMRYASVGREAAGFFLTNIGDVFVPSEAEVQGAFGERQADFAPGETRDATPAELEEI